MRLIVSGGQTGADRAALDVAIELGIEHGGWCPRGRLAEDGPIDARYALQEVDGGYRQRTKRNVQDSDGTLILNLGALEDGSLATEGFALRLGRPALVIQLDGGIRKEDIERALAWMREHNVEKLNVAGPRESKRPGIYEATRRFLRRLYAGHRLPLPRDQLDRR